MIEVNLIPDVKKEFLHVQRMRNYVISICVVVAIISGGIIVLGGVALGSIQLASSNTSETIKTKFDELKNKSDINNLVTIQNQLSKIDELHNARGINSRLIDMVGVINPQAPNNVKMSRIDANTAENSIIIEGSASADVGFIAVDALKKTILNTKIVYNDGSGDQEVPLTTEVVVSETSYQEDVDGGKRLSFSVSFVYPRELLSNSYKTVSIVSPSGTIDVTDSKLRVPDSLFGARSSNGNGGGN